MNFLLKNVYLPIAEQPDFKALIKSKFGIELSHDDNIKVMKRAIDARKKNHLNFIYTLSLHTSKTLASHNDIVIQPQVIKPERKPSKITSPPFIIGMGPAGLFAALELVQYGITPYLFDKGDDIDTRKQKVRIFWCNKQFDPNSNVQFGEGGAGTFSDGKLTARTHNSDTDEVFGWLIKFGADPDISINALPHLGTDNLINITKNIRNYLIENGCKFFYNHTLTDIQVKNNKVIEVTINNQTYTPEKIILAVGNSARDIFTLLLKKNITLENKGFAVGLRIEHDKDYIDHTFYGEKNDFNITGSATYKLVSKNAHTFCMCPGGYVIPAHSEQFGQVVNGMSYSNRDNIYSNSAIVVGVDERYYGRKILDGVSFQKKLESKCFDNFLAPVQLANDFIKNVKTENKTSSSYKLGVVPTNFHETMPKLICEYISKALILFDKKYKDFISKGLLIGVETRSSSPIRIIRHSESLHCLNIKNLYPVGEGAGYAGGIVSSAADGVRVARVMVANT